MTTPTDDDPIERCSWSDLPPWMCPGKECEGSAWPGDLEAPAPPPEPRLVVAWTPVHDKAPTPRDWSDGSKPPAKGTRCRWNSEVGAHLLPAHLATCTDRRCNGCQPCTHDDHGNPVTHCRIRRGRMVCTEHLDHAHPRTCPRCIGRVRGDLTQIEHLVTLMPDQAEQDGLQSTAAMVAGPAADPEVFQRRTLLHAEAHRHVTDEPGRRAAARALAHWEDDNRDETHPLYVLRDWEQRVREEYDAPPRGAATLSRAVSYLSWVLTDLAQDPEQDFAQLATEIADLRKHLENTLGASRAPELGAPCKDCDAPAPRLQRRRAHWCDDPDCTREHDTTGARDTWVCPRNPDHWWTEADYRKWSWERADETKGKMGA